MIASSNIQRSTFDFGPRNDADAAQQTGFEFQGRSYLGAREAEDGSLDAIDALGLWEYLTDKQAVAFLRTLYPKLKPGASMIVSNMLQSRPHPQYNQRAVGWPDLYMRTEEDMLRIVEQAGIPTQNVRLTYAEDGVYVVMEITRVGELDGA
jgi:cyclopropane fatty-acyl-phospholipid synthase-like methyltransferase